MWPLNLIIFYSIFWMHLTSNSFSHFMLEIKGYFYSIISSKSSLSLKWSIFIYSKFWIKGLMFPDVSSFWQLNKAKILNPSFGKISKLEVILSWFYWTRGSKNVKRSGGDFSIFLRISHIPFSAATVNGPFLKTNSPVSLHT